MKSSKSIQINPIPSLIFLFVFILAKFMRYCKSLFPAWKMLQLPAFSNHPIFFFTYKICLCSNILCVPRTSFFLTLKLYFSFTIFSTFPRIYSILSSIILHLFSEKHFFIFTWKKSVFKELHYCFLPLFLDDLLPTSAQLNLPAFQPQSYNNYTIIWHWLVFI